LWFYYYAFVVGRCKAMARWRQSCLLSSLVIAEYCWKRLTALPARCYSESVLGSCCENPRARTWRVIAPATALIFRCGTARIRNESRVGSCTLRAAGACRALSGTAESIPGRRAASSYPGIAGGTRGPCSNPAPVTVNSKQHQCRDRRCSRAYPADSPQLFFRVSHLSPAWVGPQAIQLTTPAAL
jgi:hypothetical protein